MFDVCLTCEGVGWVPGMLKLDPVEIPCPSCVGGRVVSEPVIEEMADYLVAHESQVTISVHSADRLARALGRVVLEHMEEHNLDNADKAD